MRYCKELKIHAKVESPSYFFTLCTVVQVELQLERVYAIAASEHTLVERKAAGNSHMWH